METVTREQAARMVEGYNGSRIFTVTFVKRTNGEIRVMNCRKGVTKHLQGGEAKYSFRDKGLVSVFDMQKQAYRVIALESITAVSFNGVQYKVI